MVNKILELGDITKMNKKELVALWEKVFGKSPQFTGSREFLKHLIAEEIQGGLPISLRRKLDNLKPNQAKLKPNTIIEKQWHGKKYTITAMEEGFAYRGKTYSSLTKIAKEITGAAWNGPRFFGLRK